MQNQILGFSKQFMDEHFQDIVDFSELHDFLDVPLKNYSSGMRSRLGFAIATIVCPDILILDEVLSVGDAKFRKKSEAKIMKMFDEGVTVLFVSHSVAQVERLCNKAILLEKGRIIAQGDVLDVTKIYREMTDDAQIKQAEQEKKKVQQQVNDLVIKNTEYIIQPQAKQ